jgi:hypothetical protein
MAWDDVAPTKDELAATSAHAWDSSPPTKDELAAPAKKSWLDTKIPGGTPRGYIQGTLDALPMAGMVAGGVLGTPADLVTGPAGTVVGAGVGAGVGQTIKSAGERFVLGKDKPNSEVLLDTAKAVPEGMAYEMGGQILSKAGEIAAKSPPAKYVAGKAGDFAKWLANNASNVPKSDIEAYLKDPEKVMSIFKEAGGDEQEMADMARKNINAKIQSTKADLNNKISETLASRAGETIEAAPIIQKLETAKGQINAKLRPEEIKEVDGLIDKVKAVSNEGGQIPLQDAHDLKELLREQAKGTYARDGQIFTVGDKAARAAKGGAAVTRSMIEDVAPEIGQSNGTLSRLHDIEDVMNKNMLAEGKPANSLFTAANGENPSNAKALRQLGEVTGTDIAGDAKNLSAARTFGSPSMTPLDKTGKAVARMGATGVIGGGLGYVAGGDEKSAIAGGLLAEGLTSPAMLKFAMDSGMGLKGLAKAGSEVAPSIVGKVGEKIAPTSLVDKTLKAAGLNSSPEAPPKGPEKWANDGFAKLMDHAGDDKSLQASRDQLLASPQGKKLLIAASDLKPGTKAMDNILAKIKALGEQK